MNKKIKSLFSGIIASTLAMALFFGCANGNDGGSSPIPTPTPVLPADQAIDLSNPAITARVIVNSMGFGWNLGNTLDANDDGGNWGNNNGGEESDWGLKNTASDALFQKIKDSGMKSVRIPISWHNHVNNSMEIDSEWMNHVKEVVNMAYSKGLFVIINIHHDNYNKQNSSNISEKLGDNAGFSLYADDKVKSSLFIQKIWSQVATEFKDYDGHLVFETLNEPRMVGGDHEWNCSSNSDNWKCNLCRSYFSIINDFNQLAVNTIRATGGNNANRVIMFPAYVAAPYAAINAKNAGIFTIPSDPNTVNNRLALSVHMYTPYNFAMNPDGHSDFTDGDKSELSQHFTDLNTTFISQEIPVVIGEMGATNRNNPTERKNWFTYYLGLCKDNGVAAILWDNGNYTNSSDPGEAFGFMNRRASGGPVWYSPELIAAGVAARN